VRRVGLRSAVGLGLALLLAAGGARAKDKAEATCGDHGTAITFFDTPSEAAKQAKKDQKLVMVLHISGHFENPEFT
jgi:hypothetical protein